MTFNRTLCIVAVLAACCGCGRRADVTAKPYETPAAANSRHSELARARNAEAVALIKAGQLDQAEAVLKDALTADAFFGPAHNNLGTVYYRQGSYYLAAWEFQYAAKLMPTKAEPLNNLGLVFEAVGRMDEAAKHYDEALSLDADCLDATGNLARVYVRQNRRDERTRELLEQVAFRDTRPEWSAWARERLALMTSRQDSPGVSAVDRPAPATDSSPADTPTTDPGRRLRDDLLDEAPAN